MGRGLLVGSCGLRAGRFHRESGDSRIGGTHLHPLLEVRDDGGGQLPLRRHLETFVSQGFEQRTLLEIACDDHRSRIATFQYCLAIIESQPAARCGQLRRMALIAVLHEDRANLCFEEFKLLSGRCEARLRGK